MNNPAGTYKPKRSISIGGIVRTMQGRYGEYILVDDLVRHILKDALALSKDGEYAAADYAEALVKALEKLKSI